MWIEPSHAITALSYSVEEARSVLRISLLPETEADEVDALLVALKKALKR